MLPVSARAIIGEIPALPFSSRDSACRVQPSRDAASVTDRFAASRLSRSISPGWQGFSMAMIGVPLGSVVVHASPCPRRCPHVAGLTSYSTRTRKSRPAI